MKGRGEPRRVVENFRVRIKDSSGAMKSDGDSLWSYGLKIAHWHSVPGRGNYMVIDLPDDYHASVTTGRHLSACHTIVDHRGFVIRETGGTWNVVAKHPLSYFLMMETLS